MTNVNFMLFKTINLWQMLNIWGEKQIPGVKKNYVEIYILNQFILNIEIQIIKNHSI
jgi:hypothetical protein